MLKNRPSRSSRSKNYFKYALFYLNAKSHPAVMCSTSMVGHVAHMVIEDDQMASDHKPLVLTLQGLALKQPELKHRREVCDFRNIPSPPVDWSWVDACRARFEEWIAETGDMMAAATAASLDDSRMADVLDWSFQKALNDLAHALWARPPRPS